MNLLLWTGHLDDSITPVLEQLKSMAKTIKESPKDKPDKKTKKKKDEK